MDVKPRVRNRFWLESSLAAATFALAVLTLITRDWIEQIFGVDPDAGSGALEWAIVAAGLVATVALVLLARREWRTAVAVAS